MEISKPVCRGNFVHDLLSIMSSVKSSHTRVVDGNSCTVIVLRNFMNQPESSGVSSPLCDGLHGNIEVVLSKDDGIE
jgi:hypothetical protein